MWVTERRLPIEHKVRSRAMRTLEVAMAVALTSGPAPDPRSARPAEP
jgi:hypothetical protein